jgi:hypothetical protein
MNAAEAAHSAALAINLAIVIFYPLHVVLDAIDWKTT